MGEEVVCQWEARIKYLLSAQSKFFKYSFSLICTLISISNFHN